MSYIGLTDTQAGINILFYDTDNGTGASCRMTSARCPEAFRTRSGFL